MMETLKTAQYRIRMLRETFRKCFDSGQVISRKKIEAQIVLSGSTPRSARELIDTFINADEIILLEENGEIVLKPNPLFYS